jgi:predicted RNA-binding protein
MCESTVYLKNASGERVLMKEVAAIRPQGGKLLITSILGEKLEIDAAMVELDLMGHRIVIEDRTADPGRR